ncbi:MAG: sporulation protein YabP [Oscillospiraceae bacterium]|nr:sporulation protein YabP [Oscillospiraceae bacterium]
MSENQIIMKDRKFLSVTGVKDVNAFTEESVVLTLESSSLIIKGETLHINKLDLESGHVDMDGKVNSLQYIKETTDKGFIRRLLR